MMVVLVDHLLEVNRLLLAKQLPHKTVTRSTSAQLTKHTKKDHYPTIPTARRSLVRREEPPHATPRSPPVRSALAGSLENNRGGRPPRVENNWRNTLEPLPRRATGPVLSGREQPD